MLSISRRIVSILALIGSVVAAMAYSTASLAQAAPYVEGRQYTRLSPAVPTSTAPGTVEVVEVFSYGCPACWQALATANKLKKSLPARAQLVYVPASWNPSEAWPMFQRAFITAQSLGIAEKTHDQMFDAIWRTGEIPLVDKATNRIYPKLPTIEDAAKFYARTAGIKAEDFVATSRSFAVETRVQQADRLVRAYRADSTPTFVVAGKFKVEPRNAGGYEEVIGIIRFLVDRELASAAPAAAPRS
jgi:thiol:disulfide interchange protein DsbA